MQTTTATTGPAHVEAARRVDLRDALAGMLRRIVPGYLTVQDFEADLFHVDACDAAEDLIEALESRGYVIRRAGQ